MTAQDPAMEFDVLIEIPRGGCWVGRAAAEAEVEASRRRLRETGG